MNYNYKWLTSDENIDDIFSLRFEVFCDEQEYPRDLEQDEHDFSDGLHLAVYDDEVLVACGRIVDLGNGLFKAGRIAVKKAYRKTGLGKYIMDRITEKVKALFGTDIYISAQTQAIGFYEKMGFVPYGIEYMDENIPHVDMKKSLVFDSCSWLESDEEAVLYRREFSVPSVKKAKISITGLGYFELFFNGKRYSENIHTPAQTDYVEYDITTLAYPIYDTLSHRILYIDYDVTNEIQSGSNCIGIHVGNGWFGSHKCQAEGYKKALGKIKLIYKLTITDNDGNEHIFVSDENGEFIKSPVVDADIYMGEIHDYRLYNPAWSCVGYTGEKLPVRIVDAPVSVIEKQSCPFDKVERVITNFERLPSDNGVIYDIGEDVSGYLVLKWNKNANLGDEATAYYTEILDENGKPDSRTVWKKSIDTFIKGDNDTLMYPRFTWHAGRFIEVTGNVEPVEFRVVHTDIDCIADFKCDNKILNWLFEAFKITMLANIHGCIPSDCPHRERLGYTGDGQLDCGAAMTVLDTKEMYKKWIRDILDCQDRTTGHIQHTAPFRGGGGGPGGWGGAICIVPWRYYEFYGEKEMLELTFEPMLKYLDFMYSRTVDGLVMSELKGGWCLGDWCAPEKVLLPEPFVNTYFFVRCINILISTAKEIGKENDKRMLHYAEIAEELKKSLVDNYFNADTGSFLDGIQGADAFMLDIGLGDRRTIDNIVTRYAALGHFDTGIFGTDILTRILFEYNKNSLATKLLTSEHEVSFFNMMKQDATTLWENWNGEASHSHPMFGAVTEYLFRYILGIKNAPGTYGYKKIVIEPAYIPELHFVKGSIKLPCGEVYVEIENGKMKKTEIR